MKRIPGWVFMLVGVAVMLYSKFIESRTDATLTLFFYLGLLFVIFGFARETNRRLIKKHKRSKQGPPVEREIHHDHRHPAGHEYHGRSHYKTHQHVHASTPHSHPHHPAQKQCPRCHATNGSHTQYCRVCGHQFH